MDEHGTTLFLSLNHPQSNVRLMALGKLKERIDAEDAASEAGEDKVARQIAKDSLVARIQDRHQQVALAALKFPKIVTIVPTDQLAEVASSILENHQVSQEVRDAAVHVLCEIAQLDECPHAATNVLFGMLLVSNETATTTAHVAQHAARIVSHLGVSSVAGSRIAKALKDHVAKIKSSSATQIQGIVSTTNAAVAEALGSEFATSAAFRAFISNHAFGSAFAHTYTVALNTLSHAVRAHASIHPDIMDLSAQLIPYIKDRVEAVSLDHQEFIDMLKSNETPWHDVVALIKFSFVLLARFAKPIHWIHLDSDVMAQHASLFGDAATAFFSIASTQIVAHLGKRLLEIVGERHILEFAAYLWTESAVPQIRLVGLMLASKIVTAPNSQTIDFQLLLPSLVVALSDDDRTVRQAAAQVVADIQKILAKLASAGTKSKQEAIYGYDTFYGSASSQIVYLTASTAAAFASDLLDWKEEITADASFLRTNLHTALQRSDASAKKTTKYKDDVLSFLLTNILAFGSLTTKTKLVDLMSNVDSPLKLKTLFPLIEKSIAAFVTATSATNTDISDADADAATKHCTLLCSLTSIFTVNAVASLFSRSSRYAKLFAQLLTADSPDSLHPIWQPVSTNALEQISPDWFSAMESDRQEIILSAMLELMALCDGNELEALKPALDVFVQALPHIPSHRRIKLFTLLANTLGADRHLGSVFALILANSITGGFHSVQRHSDSTEALNFCLSLSHQFSYKEQLTALISVVQLCKTLPNAASEFSSVLVDSNTELKTIRRTKVHLISFVSHALKSKTFAALATSAETRSNPEIDALHIRLFELVLQDAEILNGLLVESQQRPKSSDAKFSQVFMNSLQETLAAANNILVFSSFAQVIQELLQRDDTAIRHRALGLLNQRLAALANTKNLDSELLSAIMLKLYAIIKSDATDPKVAENKQHAMDGITGIARLIGDKSSELLLDGVKILLSDSCIGSPNVALVSSSMICLGALCVVLQSRIVPFLPQMAPTVIKLGQKAASEAGETEGSSPAWRMLSSVLGVFAVIVTNISQFASPYLGDILAIITSPCLKGISSRTKTLTLSISRGIAKNIAIRVLMPSLTKHLPVALSQGSFSSVTFFKLVGSVVMNTPQSELLPAVKQFGALFMQGFAYRCAGPNSEILPKDNDLEEVIVSTFVIMMMKTNESTFRPLFLRIVDWATSDTLWKNGWSDDRVYSRQQILYHLTERLFSELKSIFVPYYAYLLDNSISVLRRFVDNGKIQADLWVLIISSMKSCFTYHGTNDFVTSDKLQAILTSLMQQIESASIHEEAFYKHHMSQYLVPCIGQLAVTFRGDKTWKAMTRMILNHMRSDNPEVRWASIKALHDMYARLGEEMLVYFPETIPFLAELMEDSDDNVETACQELCQLIQHYLGEPIQPYFTA
eukprot:jgi/Hompol1/837/HPOL_000755-RA